LWGNHNHFWVRSDFGRVEGQSRIFRCGF